MATAAVFLNVQDIDKSLAFYKALGFEVVHEVRDDEDKDTIWYADLELDGAELGLGAIPASDDPEFREWVSTPLGAGVIIYFTVDDVDSVHAKAQEIGAVIEYPPQDRPYGRVFGLNDPDGYVVTFLKE